MKMSKFKVDDGLALNGRWYDIGEGARVLVAKDKNPEYVKELRAQMLRYPTTYQRENITSDESTQILCTVVSKTILLGWENIEDEDGNQILYSQGAAFDLLIKYKDFYALVMELASSADNYRNTEAVDTAKK